MEGVEAGETVDSKTVDSKKDSKHAGLALTV